MKITVVGGTGLVGQGILKELSKQKHFELHSLSRTGKRPNSIENVTYHSVDLFTDSNWIELVQNSDWLIDCVGILFENKAKNITYYNNSVLPAQKLIDTVVNTQTNFLFISANHAPFFLKNYLVAKKEVEDYGKKQLSTRFFCVFTGLVYSKQRLSNYYPAIILATLLKFTPFSFLAKYRPIARNTFAKEILAIIQGKPSALLNRI